MAAGQKRHQRALDDALLAEDDAANAIANPGNVGQRLLGIGDHVLFADRAFLDHHAHAASILLVGNTGLHLTVPQNAAIRPRLARLFELKSQT
ncbi:hypothetical protein MESS4_830091 [Mesorhizobium sp. STM 4661]|nr:hypothetical protein MESS4_830091 [Mesorhizobium sp. STM 4661]